MDGNTTADNIVALDNVVIENSAVIISIVTNFAVAAAIVSLAKPFLDISKIEFLVEKTSEDGKKEFLVSLTCMKLFGFLPIPKPMTMSKHRHMRTRFVDTPF